MIGSVIVCCTGCSINDIDWGKYKDIIKIGVNQFFHKGVVTDYYYVNDNGCVTNHGINFLSVIDKWPTCKFIIDKKVKLSQELDELKNVMRVSSNKLGLNKRNFWEVWAKDLNGPIHIMGPVTIGAINIAYVLGAKNIYIAGFDGYWGYFYKPGSYHKNGVHYSLPPGITKKGAVISGGVLHALTLIQKVLVEKSITLYNMNKESFFVEHNKMPFGTPEP